MARRNGKSASLRGGAAPKDRIDRDKLSAAIRHLDNDRVCFMLEDAVDLLPGPALVKLCAAHLDPRALRPDPETRGSLLAVVRAFEQASLRGDYYEDFNVNSKNYMDKSKGTKKWIAECNRLLDRSVGKADNGDPVEASEARSKRRGVGGAWPARATEVREAFEIIFGLLRRIDEGRDDVIFLADEAGSWQVGVSWAKVLPAWLKCLAATADPEEYAASAVAIIDRFQDYDRAKHLKEARRVANAAQRKLLPQSGAMHGVRRRSP